MVLRRTFSNSELTNAEMLRSESFTPRTAEIFAAETLETANINPTSTPIKLVIKTDRFGDIQAMFDSGASLNIVDAEWARINLKNHVRNTKDFYCTTANGKIVIRQFVRVRCANQYGSGSFFARFYLLQNSPHRHIMSRGMFWRLGYKIMRPDGRFIVESQNEQMAPDLYDNLFKTMDYPVKTETLLVERSQCADDTDFLRYLSQKNDEWRPQDPLQQFEERLESTVIPPTPWTVTKNNEVLYTLDAQTGARWHARQNAEEARRALPSLDTSTQPLERVGLSKQQILEEAKLVHGKIHSRKVKQEFYDLLVADGKMYAAHMADIGVIPGIEFEIKLKPDAQPFHSRPYPHSREKAIDSRRQIQELLAGRFVRVSESSWASPYTMVPKPTRKGKKEWRMAVDYRGLNSRTVKNRYPIPSMRDLYAKLRGGRVFSCLDLRSGYHHIAIKKEDQHKTAFITEYGLFEWTRMSFGFSNAPSVFQRAMDMVFGDMQEVLIYLDDIVISTATEEDHIRVLKEVFARLKKHGMTLRLIKCKFFQTEVKYLGMICNKNGIRCDEEYVKKVLTFKAPTTIKELERYLGMVAWLGRFIPNLSRLTAKLTSMGKKTFVWSEEHQRHFEAIQRAVHSTKLLRHPDLSRRFFVQCDASETALGAVLLQDFGGKQLEPIEFISRKLTDCETRWHCSEQELVAVVYALNRWIKFLLPKPFTVFTDHKNLEVLFTKGPGMKSKKLQRWIVMLQQFDFMATYLPGKENYIADFLSRDVQALFFEMLPIIARCVRKSGMQHNVEIDLCEFLWLESKSTEPRAVHAEPALNRIHSLPVHQATCFSLQPRRSTRLSQKERLNYDQSEEVEWRNYGKKRFKPRHELPDVVAEKTPLSVMANEVDWTSKLSPQRFRRAFARDQELQRLKGAVSQGTALATFSADVRAEIADKRLVVNNGLLFRANLHGRMTPVVPASMRSDVIKFFHTARVFCHQGATRTYTTMRQWYYWRGMKESVAEYCTSCTVCIATRLKRHAHAKGRIKQIRATAPFEMISMDIVGPLPMCNSGSRYLLTIMDRFTRYVAAIPLSEVTAQEVAMRFFNEWILRYGPPQTLLADNGTQFTSDVLHFTCKLLGVKQRFATIYHPECNGQIERWHRFLKQRLAIRQKEHSLNFLAEDDWDIYVPSVVYSYNASVHSITNHSPFELLYGRLPNLPLKLAELGKVKVPPIVGYDDYLAFLVQTLSILRNKVLQTTFVKSRSLSQRLNRDRDDFDFKVGELVYRLALGLKGNVASFTDKWQGPYEVVSVTPNGAYQLRHVHDEGDQPLLNGKYLCRLPKAALDKYNKNSKGRQ